MHNTRVVRAFHGTVTQYCSVCLPPQRGMHSIILILKLNNPKYSVGTQPFSAFSQSYYFIVYCFFLKTYKHALAHIFMYI